jgi:putative aldouronate transport system permease protein
MKEIITNTTKQSVRLKEMTHKQHSISKRLIKSWQLYTMFLLPLIYVLVFKYYPMYGAQIAFRDFVVVKGITGSDWVGFKFFITFIHSYEFSRILNNTLGLAIYHLAVGFPFPIILALSLNYVKKALFKKSIQMITYAPHFISVVVMVGIVLQFLDPRTGLINKIIVLFGFESIQFMAKPELFKSIYVWSDVWQNMGFACIIYLAALSSISPSLHEAAVMDGATKLNRMWHIDIPGILPVAIILLILNVGNLLDIGFEKVLLLQNSLNLRTSEVIDTYVYKVGLTSSVPNFSYASAIGLFKSAVNLILLVSLNRIAKLARQESLW